ncbi:MAG: DUF4338 domain-containing protein [Bacteroidota bacterium]|nr:DUF4338 domain-containing protein [Bacteroidota bacterium]MDE2644984.1 DUF4338 domain-containing protein [Bacteroidota bacterium]MXW33102.1 DUF4338 domain-containing protein [Rhodothermaceae bacterium]MYE63856.1 DUF4338 domain-containing protein [Rhodothermaceae bacterium]MYJ20282.1 DUF4338 domain-containing protein [Rhodothermaceae bacterium]
MDVHSPILAIFRGALPAVTETIAAHSEQSCSALGRVVCRQFNFVGTRGKLRHAGCMKALSLLEGEGHITLPANQSVSLVRGPRLLDTPVPQPTGIPSEVSKIQDLEIVQVTGSADRAIWNTVLASEHPLGTTTFAGAQLRYLFQSAHGILGAIGFSGAALYLKPREVWMAWDHSKRQKNLHRVLNLSRYLVRSDGTCKNLGSYLLSRVLRRLLEDFRAKYGYRPYIIETFVGPAYEGTCFRGGQGLNTWVLPKGRDVMHQVENVPAPQRRCLGLHSFKTGVRYWLWRLWSYAPIWRWGWALRPMIGRCRSLGTQIWAMPRGRRRGVVTREESDDSSLFTQ